MGGGGVDGGGRGWVREVGGGELGWGGWGGWGVGVGRVGVGVGRVGGRGRGGGGAVLRSTLR